MTLGSLAASWMSSTQTSVSISTCQGEHVALGDGENKALFAMGVLTFTVLSLLEASTKFANKKGGYRSRRELSELIEDQATDVRNNFVRELVTSKVLAVENVSSEKQHTDNHTRAPSGAHFRVHKVSR